MVKDHVTHYPHTAKVVQHLVASEGLFRAAGAPYSDQLIQLVHAEVLLFIREYLSQILSRSSVERMKGM